MTDLHIADEDDLPVPDKLPSLRYLLDTNRSSHHPAPFLEPYTYLDVSYFLDEKDLHAAERAFEEHMEACADYEIDGCDPPEPYCGCGECYSRATAGFWISYIMDALRSGRASVDEPPPITPKNPDQLELELQPASGPEKIR